MEKKMWKNWFIIVGLLKTNHSRRLIDFGLHKINLDIVTIDLMEKTNKSVGDLWARWTDEYLYFL